jgi:hypothetical protein
MIDDVQNSMLQINRDEVAINTERTKRARSNSIGSESGYASDISEGARSLGSFGKKLQGALKHKFSSLSSLNEADSKKARTSSPLTKEVLKTHDAVEKYRSEVKTNPKYRTIANGDLPFLKTKQKDALRGVNDYVKKLQEVGSAKLSVAAQKDITEHLARLISATEMQIVYEGMANNPSDYEGAKQECHRRLGVVIEHMGKKFNNIQSGDIRDQLKQRLGEMHTLTSAEMQDRLALQYGITSQHSQSSSQNKIGSILSSRRSSAGSLDSGRGLSVRSKGSVDSSSSSNLSHGDKVRSNKDKSKSVWPFSKGSFRG